MSESGPNGSSSNGQKVLDAAPLPRARRRPSWPFIVLAVLFVVVPFLTWYLTWFGRPLSDDDIGRYLGDQKNVRHVQQALTQIEERIEKGDEGVKRWYPQIVALAESPVAEVRKTVAWVMGQDNKAEEFHASLRKLVADAHPAVRRNAAVQLVRFQDTSGRAELRAMLVPYDLTAPVEGTIASVLGEGGEVRENALVARITDAQNQVREVRSPLHGKIVRVQAVAGGRVNVGDVLLTLAPDAEFVYEALRALFLVGEGEDLKEVERYAQGVEGMPARVKEQAAQTAKAIRGRSESKGSSRQ
ncbi:MAG TPA: HlyD family efflux transporter periplasmic adaptor subunit [Pyrinomonadaceae bacterium]|nr:HlyD family efflux transporter periplasmic adaptor subunit [Pyrinomonadaceae bacterium]